jgi:hypothetical protein
MSEKLDLYLNTMEVDFNSIQNDLELEKANPTNSDFLNWYLSNNDTVKKYITHLSIGANLGNKEDDLIAYTATFKKHVETMNLFYKLYLGHELFKKVD